MKRTLILTLALTLAACATTEPQPAKPRRERDPYSMCRLELYCNTIKIEGDRRATGLTSDH